MTPHIEAGEGDYARRVLLPGDPERAAWIAATLFDGPRQVNSVRGALGFTGTYRGMAVSVQTTGIGRPSLAIYVHELLKVYGANVIVRVGTCGGLDADVALRSLVIADAAAMDFETGQAEAWRGPDEALLERAVSLAGRGRAAWRACPMVSSDFFYHDEPLGRFGEARARGALACDMETALTYGMAASLGARALSICTVVDNLVTGEEIPSSDRQEVFAPMARLALETLVEDYRHEAGKGR